MQELRDADLVIEAIVESEDIKKKLFVELDKITKPSAILASNTSSISITRLASATNRPCQVSLISTLSFNAASSFLDSIANHMLTCYFCVGITYCFGATSWIEKENALV